MAKTLMIKKSAIAGTESYLTFIQKYIYSLFV